MLIERPIALEGLLHSRKGGIYNLRGIIYQINYTIWRLLTEFSKEEEPNLLFQVEGIEDLDFHAHLSECTMSEYTQIKCLDKFDIDDFHGIVKNLLDVYVSAPTSKFKIVSNQHVPGGKVGDIKYANIKQLPLSQKTFEFWAIKIRAIQSSLSDEQITDFLSKIQFDRKTEAELEEDSLKLLIKNYDIVQGNERHFYVSLSWTILEWSKIKKEIIREDLIKAIEQIKDDRFENRALREGWIQKILFDARKDIAIESAYFEGKAARPHHIAANLPVSRPEWENRISESITKYDVTVIKSSSGQGKSTLAWRVAHIMQEQGYSVFELFNSQEDNLQDQINFLKSREKIKVLSLVVIDGLNHRVKDWVELAARARDLKGIKFLVTTREEDWFRYGNGASRLYLQPVNVELTKDEAPRIFEKFKKKGLICNSPRTRTWQIVWEEVKSEKLLLEFVYLITQGKMLRERLSEQFSLMRNDPDNAEKKAVLRLVSVADILNLNLSTHSLIHYLKATLKFQGDYGDFFQSLKNEYQIQSEDAGFIEGLHPVRSKHVSELLHETLPISDTLSHLATMLNADSLLDFATRSPRLLYSESEKSQFFNTLAKKISEKSYSEILEVVNGIFGSDAYQHWHDNKEIYDKVSTQGLMLYSSLRTPFSGLNPSSFSVLTNINPQFEENLNKISQYHIENSNLSLFLQDLHAQLSSQAIKSSLAGALDLERWFFRFGLSMNLIQKLTISNIKTAITDLGIESLGQVLRGIFLLDESFYLEIYQNYSVDLMVKLLRDTNTLQIGESKKKSLEIRYILNDEEKAHEQSINRLRQIAYVFPFYQNYEIQGIGFPNPFLIQLREKYDESQKNATWENWLQYDPFRTKANTTWISVIDQEYEFSTTFEWQEYWFDFRQTFLAWLKQASRVLESIILRKNFSKEEKEYLKITNSIIKKEKQERAIRYDFRFLKKKFENTVKKINNWSSMAQTVMFQFSKITDENSRRLLCLNSLDLFQKLSAMQGAFEEISLHTGYYFDFQSIDQQETKIHRYFSELTNFYHEVFVPYPTSITNVRQEVKNWVESQRRREMKKIEKIKPVFDAKTGFDLILPSHIIEEPHFNSVVLGIRNITMNELGQSIDELLYLTA